ncbi:MAG: cyclic 2,3-diphosphoglycerate synthase [Thermoleophilaceae bacterium]|jgi:cyclic 2,3-diphosphoglycerate synthetase|nr:cyclic 2,3-diphosphoglycerate synthase [Thermoleophilaceae bacterium]
MGGPIVLIDGEHHPSVVRDALATLAPIGAVWCGGEEKVPRAVLDDPAAHYGLAFDPAEPREAALRRLAPGADCVLDLADEPVLDAPAKLRLASLALHLGLAYETATESFEPPRYERLDFAGRTVAVIGTGKRTGKTAVACHLAGVLRQRGRRPAIVSMGRGGPPEPVVAAPDTSLENLEALAAAGRHAASDYLEDAVLAGVPTVGCRRVGGSLAGVPFDTNMAAGARMAAALDGVDTLILEGSGACVPPVEADATVCIVGDPADALGALGPYRLLRADLVLAMRDAPRELAELSRGPVVRVHLEPEPAEELPAGARVAFFSTGAGECAGLEPVVSSRNLARREALAADLERAAEERCDVYLTELKAAAIDTVAAHARRAGGRVVFVRNRVVADGADLDGLLAGLGERDG